MEESIQFVANCRGWVSVRKLKVTEATDPRTVLEFLASLNTGIDRKVEEYLGKIVDLAPLDSALTDVLGDSGKTPGEAIKAVNSLQVNKAVNELAEGLEKLQKGEKKEVSEFLKVYAMRKALKEKKIRVDYSEIAVPGMKKVKKTKV